MPKRVIDFEAMWASDKLAACAEWAQTEYAWFYGLADASGSFELTNLRVIWGRVAAVRKNLSLERLEQIFDEFRDKGLLFVWEENGKRYAHWTGSDVPGRLPPPSWRNRLEKLAPAVPRGQLAKYLGAFSRSAVPPRAHRCHSGPAFAGRQSEDLRPSARFERGESPPPQHAQPLGTARASSSAEIPLSPAGAGSLGMTWSTLKGGLERPQAQEGDLERDWDPEREREEGEERAGAREVPASRNGVTQILHSANAKAPEEESEEQDQPVIPNPGDTASSGVEGATAWTGAHELLAIYAEERGALPEARELTAERSQKCAERLRAIGAGHAPEFLRAFREAVRRAALTPFLCGANGRNWRATFDWFIVNEANVCKVLEGRYDAFARASSGHGAAARSWRDDQVQREQRAGLGPPGPHRVKPEALERDRLRRETESASAAAKHCAANHGAAKHWAATHCATNQGSASARSPAAPMRHAVRPR